MARNPAVVGQQIRLDRRPYTVVGVMPREFPFPHRGLAIHGEPAEVWLPIAFTEQERAERGYIARARPLLLI
jgi:putative ABC transport system permease protein